MGSLRGVPAATLHSERQSQRGRYRRCEDAGVPGMGDSTELCLLNLLLPYFGHTLWNRSSGRKETATAEERKPGAKPGKARSPPGALPWTRAAGRLKLQDLSDRVFGFWVCLFLLLVFPSQIYTEEAETYFLAVELGNYVLPSN